MVVFPNAKINLGLWIVERRSDGYHNLESCFCPVPWKDALEFIESNSTEFSSSGLEIPGDPKDNLVLKAYHLLKEKYELPELKIHLHKQIPMGAGLGGGSSDAAFFLKAVNREFNLGIESKELENLAAELGADCPFFIENNLRFVKGTGDVFEPIELSLQNYYISIVYPGVHISTKEAFASINPGPKNIDMRSILAQPLNIWRETLSNDFEAYAFEVQPQLRKLKQELYNRGAEFALMSGSGSSIYALSSIPMEIDDLPYPSFTARL